MLIYLLQNLPPLSEIIVSRAQYISTNDVSIKPINNLQRGTTFQGNEFKPFRKCTYSYEDMLKIFLRWGEVSEINVPKLKEFIFRLGCMDSKSRDSARLAIHKVQKWICLHTSRRSEGQK